MTNFSTVLLQAAQPQGGGLSMLIMMVLIIVVMYFFMIRPQQKKQKELAKFRSSLQKGDKVVTIGGIYGKIVDINDQYVTVDVGGDVRIKMDKSAILKDMSDAQTR
jgi:preprotein translocase, YajC subunit